MPHNKQPRAKSAGLFIQCNECIGVVALVGNDCPGVKAFNQGGGVGDIGQFSACQYPAQRIAQGIHRGMNLDTQPPRAWCPSCLGASGMLMRTHHGVVNKKRLQIGVITDRLDDPLPDAFLARAREACIRRMPVAQGQIAPW